MKTTLTIEESARLIELGVDAKLASNDKVTYNKNGKSYCQPIYSLADLLSILPKEIEDNGVTEDLNIIMSNDSVYVSYPYIHERLKVFIVAPELIDALYQLLIWCLEQGFVNSNSDKKNGIILNGKVFEVVDNTKNPTCKHCDIREFCEKQYNDYNVYICHGLSEDDPVYFRFSQELTDKLNKR